MVCIAMEPVLEYVEEEEEEERIRREEGKRRSRERKTFRSSLLKASNAKLA